MSSTKERLGNILYLNVRQEVRARQVVNESAVAIVQKEAESIFLILVILFKYWL